MKTEHSKINLKTHLERLSDKINLKVENIKEYCKNNNVSKNMEKRIISLYYKDNNK